MIDFALLSHFIAVAQTRSFTRASEEVHASQSVVSRSVKRLEAQVGTPLFERTTRSVTLTQAGEAFLAESLAIRDRLAVATADTRRIGEGNMARLRIGICPSAEQETNRVARGIASFRQDWPSIDLKILPIMRIQQAAALRASDIDIGLMRLSHNDCAGIEWKVMKRDPLFVAVPAIWGIRKRNIHLAELRGRPWLISDPDVAPDMHQLHMELCRGAGFEPRIAAFVGDMLTAKMMLACGMGACFANDPGELPQGQKHIHLIRLIGISEHFCSETVIAWATGAKSKHISAFVRSIIE